MTDLPWCDEPGIGTETGKGGGFGDAWCSHFRLGPRRVVRGARGESQNRCGEEHEFEPEMGGHDVCDSGAAIESGEDAIWRQVSDARLDEASNVIARCARGAAYPNS
jgi:hypothetical protein